MTQLSVHDMPWELYDAIDVDERGGEDTYWKVLDTPTLRIVIFRPEHIPPIKF